MHPFLLTDGDDDRCDNITLEDEDETFLVVEQEEESRFNKNPKW